MICLFAILKMYKPSMSVLNFISNISWIHLALEKHQSDDLSVRYSFIKYSRAYLFWSEIRNLQLSRTDQWSWRPVPDHFPDHYARLRSFSRSNPLTQLLDSDQSSDLWLFQFYPEMENPGLGKPEEEEEEEVKGAEALKGLLRISPGREGRGCKETPIFLRTENEKQILKYTFSTWKMTFLNTLFLNA